MPKTLLTIKRSTLAFVNFTKIFSKRMFVDQILKRNRFEIALLYQISTLKFLTDGIVKLQKKT